MDRSINNSSRSDAGTLWGVRVCGFLVGCGAMLAAMCCVLFGATTFLNIKQPSSGGVLRPLIIFLCSLTLTYALLRICAGLFRGFRFAQLGGIAFGVFLLFFCWALVHDARGPSNPKAPDAQELDGPMLLIAAPTALWLISYLSTKRVSAKFLSSDAKDYNHL